MSLANTTRLLYKYDDHGLQCRATRIVMLSEEQKRLEFVYEYADILFRIHGLYPSWTFTFDRAKTRYGCCHHSINAITLSKYLVLNPATPMRVIKNVILHEIAHALVGFQEGHGDVWRQCAINIGCDGERLCSHHVDMPGQKLVRCTCGANHFYRFRITKKIRTSVCKFCRSPLFIVNEMEQQGVK